MDNLSQLFLKLENQFLSKHYILKIMNRRKFRKQFMQELNLFDMFDEKGKEKNVKQFFVFNEKMIDEYVCNFMIYKWLYDHHDKRCRDFTFVLIPRGMRANMKDISFEDLMHFISPQTKKTNEKI